MSKSFHPSGIIMNILLLVVLIAIWIAFAPTMIGGWTSYVIVNGNSMEPGFHRGDLAIVRTGSMYSVGDIVIYHNAELNAFVIHRIIAIEQEHYVFKGDNNPWIDTYRPTRAELIGKLWIHIPKLGKAMQWLRLPIHMGLATALLGGVLMASSMTKNNRRGKRKNNSSANYVGTLEGVLYLSSFSFLLFLGLSIFAFIRPLTRPADKIQYQQESQFSYSATGTPIIYDGELVHSGEPIFPRLTCFLDIGYSYRIAGAQLQGISGSYQLIARVMDEESGWQRTIPMNERTAFNGNSFLATSTLDLCQIVSLVNTLKQETGLRANTYTLEIILQTVITAQAEGNQISDSFEPALVFQFDEVHFFLSTLKGQDDPLHMSKLSSADNFNLEPNVLSIMSWKLPIGSIRLFGLLGLIVSSGALSVIGWRIFKTARQNQEESIRLRYGSLLVNVYERDLMPASAFIDVTAIDELAKLAERHNTVILHMTLNFLHCYLVQSNGITYRYVFSSGKRGVAEIEPTRTEIVEYPIEARDTDVTGTKLNEDELFGYVINKSRTANAEIEETVIMRKIRL
jgi:signal peptidase